MTQLISYLGYLVVLIVLAVPLGAYINRAMTGEKTILTKVLSPLERGFYRLIGVKKEDEMNRKQYTVSVLLFSAAGLVFLFLLQLCQGFLPGNPQKLSGVDWDLSLNTAISFVTNTNWQAYSGESTLSILTQAMGLTVQNFVSAATGIAVLFAMFRGFTRTKTDKLGNFWVDLTRSVLYVLLPLSIVVTLLLAGNGVVQTFKGYETVTLLEPVEIEGEIITEGYVPLGTAASQVAIKQLGTNGGGYMGVNSCHPLENPNNFSNLVEVISILLIPAALCFSFGVNVKKKKQGVAIFAVMLIFLLVSLAVVHVSESAGTPVLAQNGTVDLSTVDQAGGNMEGKESRFGIVGSTTWAVFTTAASNGSVNCMHDSLTPLGGMITLLLMELGEVIFGGVGCGLYGMLAFAILTVFIAGLMVGRTPEFLGKKIEPYDMKWTVLVCLATPIAVLVGSGVAVVVPSVLDSLNNTGAHGFSEILYAYSSAGGNNGSAFAGFGADTVFLNLTLGAAMLFARFIPIVGVLAIAGNLAGKKAVAESSGTLSTTNGVFIFLLIFVVLLIGALSFFPALALGPIAEYFQM